MKALVLAAGCSRRMGQQKQLLVWQGKTLLQHCIDKLNEAGFEVLTVLGSNAAKISPDVMNSKIVVNENWAEGMGHSLAYGIKKFNAEVSAVLITQPDQLALNSSDFLLLKSHALRWPKKIICSYFHRITQDENNGFSTRKIMGVPAIFPAEYFSELMKLNKNSGARKMIQQALDEAEKDSADQKVAAIPLQNASININTPEDWRNWQQSQQIDFSSEDLLLSKMKQKET
ncbi:MAG TPA: nucleotidyltransferase family protein [Aeromonadales bacterium]|nr:nucleotidyltransferase family protein [Aeromonadales bacterium]